MVTVTMTKGILSPCVLRASSSLAISTLPLKGCSSSGWKAASTTQLTGVACALNMWARVVSKGMLMGMRSPGFTREPIRMFSAARP